MEGQKEESKLKEYYTPQEARNFFLNPRNFTQDQEYIQNIRLLSQIYETVYNLYESRKSDSYLPSEKEVYEDLEFRKKAISDRTPLPPKEEIYRYYFMLADHEPGFLCLLRELRFDVSQKFYFITRFAIPFHGNADFLSKALTQVIHNSLVSIRNHIHEISPASELKEQLSTFKSIQDLERILDYGQATSFFKKIYFSKSHLYTAGEKDIYRMQRINQRIKEILLKPLVYQAVKEGYILSLKRKIDAGGMDILLVNNIAHIETRLQLLLDLLFSEYTKRFLMEHLPHLANVSDTMNRMEFAVKIAGTITDRPQDIPKGLLLLVTEILAIHEFLEKQREKERLESDKEELKQIINRLSKANGILRVKNKDKMMVSSRVLEYILRGNFPSILFATLPVYSKFHTDPEKYDEIYLLLNDKQQIAKAVEQAKELFFKVKDTLFVRLLEQMLQYYTKPEEEIASQMTPALKEVFEELLTRSYWNRIPFFKRILYSLVNKTLSREELREYWKEYLLKNKFPEKENPQSTAKEEKPERKHKEGENKQNVSGRLYQEVLQKIEWYLERDVMPTEKILYRDFEKQKKELDQIFQSITAGMKSMQEIIPVETKQDVYLFSRRFLKQNKERIETKFKQKLQDVEGIKTKSGQVIALKKEVEKAEVYRKILQILNQV